MWAFLVTVQLGATAASTAATRVHAGRPCAVAGWLGRGESRAERIRRGEGVLWRRQRAVFYLGGGKQVGNWES